MNEPTPTPAPPTLPTTQQGGGGPKDRITVVEHIYHQGKEGLASPHSHGFSRNLETSEQPYTRTFTINVGDWVPLTKGWIEQVGMMVLVNGKDQEESKRASSGVLHLSFQKEPLEEDWIIPFGESMRGTPCPARMANAKLRAVGGPVRCTIVLYPA